MIRCFLALACLLLLAACGVENGTERRACELVPPALVRGADLVRLTGTRVLPGEPRAVRVDYEVVPAPAERPRRFVVCTFQDGPDGLTLQGLETEEGIYGAAQVVFLERFWLRRPGAVGEAQSRMVPSGGPALPDAVPFLVQAVWNGLPGAGVLALLAGAYALLTGLTGRMNLALGDLAMIGAYGCVSAILLALLAGQTEALGLVLGLLGAVVATAAAGWLLGRTVVAPSAGAEHRLVIVSTLGVALVIQEGLRLLEGANPLWIPPAQVPSLTVLDTGGLDVRVTATQGFSVACTLVLAGGLLLTMTRTAFGRAWRAVADDPLAATLLGIAPRAILITSTILAGALAGVAGALLAAGNGHAHYALGTIIGLKAMLGAILGGVGSVPGAIAGGLAIGLFEALWSAYLPIVYRDVAVYALLSCLLVWRPGGLLNAPTPDGRP